MNDWMGALARHYAEMRRRHPWDDLLIVFDVDGTILDMRHMVWHVLLSYDREHGTDYFYGLSVEDVDVHENQVEPLLLRLGLPEPARRAVHAWYLERRWSSEAVLASHRPFRGVMDIVRWFQLQPRTAVGLNTGRPEALRRDTLACLNELGREYRVRFDDELLLMNPGAWEERVQHAKARNLELFRERGHHVVAMVDNEPSNLAAMAEADPAGEILFLHADTLFESARRELPRTVAGTRYDLAALLGEEDLPCKHVQLVWQGADERAGLAAFLGSSVLWGAARVRRDPAGRLVVRPDSFEERPWRRDEEELALGRWLAELDSAGKSAELELDGAAALDGVLAAVAGLDPERVAFRARIEDLGQPGFERLARAVPGAALSCAVDFLAPMLLGAPAQARDVLEMLRGWGVSRFSLSWPAPRRALEQLAAFGLDVDLRDVRELEGFLQAALLLPRSLGASFDFPDLRARAGASHALPRRDGPGPERVLG